MNAVIYSCMMIIMVITFNYQNGTQTISFADLEKSELGSNITALGAPRQSALVPLLYKPI